MPWILSISVQLLLKPALYIKFTEAIAGLRPDHSKQTQNYVTRKVLTLTTTYKKIHPNEQAASNVEALKQLKPLNRI